MKSLTAVCQTGASMPAINPNGRISRHPPHRGDGENAEMKMYLSKLKDLVPFMPKNRKLSKLEIIQHVIDYICDLQSELETHPEINNFDATAALSFATSSLARVTSSNHDDDDDEDAAMYEDADAEAEERLSEGSPVSSQQHHHQHQSSPAPRQPLVDRQTPNTILPPAATQQQRQMNASAVVSTQHQMQSTALAAAVTTTPANTVSAQTLTHTLSGEKDMHSRQSC